MPNPVCPNCGDPNSFRIKRQGFIQNKVASRLGRFPWECTGCRKSFMATERGEARRRRSKTGQEDAPTFGSGGQNPADA